jgi:hypothetical protein
MMQVFDELLTPDEAAHIERTVTDDSFPWYISAAKQTTVTAAYAQANYDRNVQESTQMVHTICTPPHGVISQHTELAQMVAQRVMSAAKIEGRIIRAKFNFLARASTTGAGKYHTPHIDSYDPHHVAIYYVNDSDGDTRIFTRVAGEPTPVVHTVAQAVSPKAGRVVLFSGRQYHASASPVHSAFRIVLNLNILEN